MCDSLRNCVCSSFILSVDSRESRILERAKLTRETRRHLVTLHGMRVQGFKSIFFCGISNLWR